MRALPSVLLAAQRSATARPYVSVELVEKLGAATRLRWERLYSGEEPDCHTDATMPGDGSLVRLRGGGGIYRQRVPDPGPESDFSHWYYWGYTGSDVGVCSRESEVLAFWVQSTGWLRRRESTTCGDTWSDPIDMTYIGGDCADYRVAACFKANGDALVLYSDGATVYRRRRIGGVWEQPAPWTSTLTAVTGIAVVHFGDWNAVVSGVDAAGGPGLWTCVLGDGYTMAPDSWSELQEVIAASADSYTEYLAPSLDIPDVCRLFFVERYAGDEPYSRPHWSHSLPSADFISSLWREPVPFNLDSAYGVALTHDISHAWLCAPYAVWRARILPQSVELSDDVIALTTAIRPFSGRLQLTLRNDDGRYNDPQSPITPGSEAVLRLGYHTSEGPKSATAPAFWLEAWEHVTAPGHSTFVLHARDGWSLLERWRARRQFTWQAGARNIFQLLAFLFARAGLELTSYSPSSAIIQTPAFTIHPGQSALTAVQRLLDMVPDVILFIAQKAYLTNPQASDESTYSYGTDHAILRGRYREEIASANRAQVFGDALMTEEWSWNDIEDVCDRLVQVQDINLDTTDKAHQRGVAVIRDAEMERLGGELLAPMNCGQDLFDVIDVTSPQAGLCGARRRVLALAHGWGPATADYTLRMALGLP